MQLGAALGLEKSGFLKSVDKSIFRSKKSDRSSANPTPSPAPALDGGHLSRDDELQAAPALPPLGALGSNSFANLLNQIDVSSTSKATEDATVCTPPAELSSVPEASATSSLETLRQQNAMSPRGKDNMEFVTTGTYFSTLANNASSGIPERQQSNTSTASYSKRSEISSVQSLSSRSSLEDVPEKLMVQRSVNPATVQPGEIAFLAESFHKVELDLELMDGSNIGNTVSLFNANTNKPLPPAPSNGPHELSTSPRVLLPELDSAPANKEIAVAKVVQYNRSLVHNNTANTMPLVRMAVSTDVQAIGGNSQIMPPRRNPARLGQKQLKPKKSAMKKPKVDLAERVILHIMLNLASISDLQSTAMVSKGFYRVFKRYEGRIVESVMRNMSVPAWELRQLVRRESKRNPFQIRPIQRDLAALRALQAFIMMRCNRICRASTLDGLAGNDKVRRANVDDALWRIWNFCKLFGKGTAGDSGMDKQVLWLQGKRTMAKLDKASSHVDGARAITKSELEDMSEMWRCMEMLLSGFRGREPEALEAGVFEQCEIDAKNGKTQSEYLEDWIYDILSVGPKAVLTMISCSFEHAKVLGVNKWTPPRQGRSRRTFLKAALEQVYRDLLVEEARVKAEDFAKSMQRRVIKARPSSNDAPIPKPVSPLTSKFRRTDSIRGRRHSVHENQPNLTDVKPQIHLEIRPDCDPESLTLIPTTSPSTNPASFSSVTMMSNASARLGATLFPVPPQNNMSLDERVRRRMSMNQMDDFSDLDLIPKVIDPTDRAFSLLTNKLGFPEQLARQALAMSDNGAGIDVNRAVELLSEDRRLGLSQNSTPVAETPVTSSGMLPAVQQIKEYCEGTCRRVSLLNRRKSNLRALMSRASFKSSSPLGAIMDNESEDTAVQHLAKSAIVPSVTMSMPTVYEAQPESKNGHSNFAEFIRYRNSLRSHSSMSSHPSSKGHKKSASTGTLDFSEKGTERTSSPISPITPTSSLGGFVTIRPFDQILENEAEASAARPKITLTRVGTGKRPSKKISLTKSGATNPGQPPEIIGYAY